MGKTMNDAMGDLAHLERAIAASPYDAVIAVSPENVRYVGDVHIDTQRRIRDRLAIIVWPKHGKPVFLVCSVEAGYVKLNTWIADIRTYQEFVLEPVVALADILHEMKIDSGHVAIEIEYFAAKYYNALLQQCPKLKVSAAEPLFAGVRMFKTAREKTRIIHAFHATEKAFLKAFSSAKVGDPERAVAIRLAESMLTEGADQVTSNHCNAGVNTCFPHMPSSDYRIRLGDIVKSDSGGMFQQYYSNVGRTAKMGKPSAEDLSVWKKLREVHHTVIEQCRIGKTGRELFELAKQTQQRLGLDFTYSHNGHSIGLNGHEHPIIGPHENIPYQLGMITTVETRARFPGKVGYHMEDIIEITEGAPIWHAKYFPNEELLVVE
ncbi:MAG: aminopeptidase P family protein [Betaproteobacteria bacterium]|nr:aminopeptidase P family protein [Betaproteobacteria bacterium]